MQYYFLDGGSPRPRVHNFIQLAQIQGGQVGVALPEVLAISPFEIVAAVVRVFGREFAAHESALHGRRQQRMARPRQHVAQLHQVSNGLLRLDLQK